jgi:hypothetical protein
MTIDLERLAVDADYWDEVAPEGATHFMYSEKFIKWVDNVEWEFYAFSDRVWKEAFCDWSLQDYINRGDGCVTAKPAAQEGGGEGLPPVGTECEVRHCGLQTWVKARVVGHDYDIAVCHVPDAHGYLGYGADYIRPIRSQAERERKELATFLEDYHLEMGSYWCPEKEADYILSSYDVAKKAKGES